MASEENLVRFKNESVKEYLIVWFINRYLE